MKRLFHWDSVEEWLKAGPKLPQIWGSGNIELISLALDATSGMLLDGIGLPGFGRGGRISSRSLGLRTSPVAGFSGVCQRVCFLLPGKERVLCGARVPCQGR